MHCCAEGLALQCLSFITEIIYKYSGKDHRSEYEDPLRAFSTFPVGVVMYARALEHDEVTRSDLCSCTMVRKASTMRSSANTGP